MTAPRVRVAHVITKLGLGGAQETVLGLCAGLDATRFQVRVLCGPEVDEGGDMFADFAQAGVDVEVVAAMGRSVRAVGDGRALKRSVPRCGGSSPKSCTPTRARPAPSAGSPPGSPAPP